MWQCISITLISDAKNKDNSHYQLKPLERTIEGTQLAKGRCWQLFRQGPSTLRRLCEAGLREQGEQSLLKVYGVQWRKSLM